MKMTDLMEISQEQFDREANRIISNFINVMNGDAEHIVKISDSFDVTLESTDEKGLNEIKRIKPSDKIIIRRKENGTEN